MDDLTSRTPQTGYWWRPELDTRNYSWQTRLKKEYGITPDQYWEMHDSQDGLCAICQQVPNWNRLVVDHDHNTGKVRELLCHGCNTSIRINKDIRDLTQAERDYLLRHGSLQDYDVHVELVRPARKHRRVKAVPAGVDAPWDESSDSEPIPAGLDRATMLEHLESVRQWRLKPPPKPTKRPVAPAPMPPGRSPEFWQAVEARSAAADAEREDVRARTPEPVKPRSRQKRRPKVEAKRTSSFQAEAPDWA